MESSQPDPLIAPRWLRLNTSNEVIAGIILQAQRVLHLLTLPSTADREDLRDCLDLLLGALYALALAHNEGYEHRLAPTEPATIRRRAEQLVSASIRTDGKWIAGFHLNSAMLRLSAVADRILKIVLPKLGEKSFKKRSNEAEKKYGWKNESIRAIHLQANNLKHDAIGTHSGRRPDADLTGAIKGADQLLNLLEAWLKTLDSVEVS